MASLSAVVQGLLTSAFAATNATLAVGSSDRVSVYDSVIPGVPTNRYALLYAGQVRRSNSTIDGLSRDGWGRFQVTVAATRPDSSASPAPRTDWLAKTVLDALVDTTVTTVDGLGLFVIQQDEVDTYPVPVEVVQDRVTVEHALLFVFLADRI